MDIKPHFQDALDYLAPLFGDKRATLEEFLEPDPSIADYADFVLCNRLRYAGANVGLHFLAEYNEGKFDKDPDLSGLLTFAFRQYSANVYHNARCTIRHPAQNTPEISQKLRHIVTCLSNKERLPGAGRLNLQICRVGEMAEVIGAVLARQHEGRKLGEFAKMDPGQATRFLGQAAEQELRRN